ncbi:ATP-binding protein [Mycobacterium vicinigordonae]|uniref:ATP-binding protein n=1 Tax=Mycobacterium vicinigordonae TaxID=1719132 RepID=A0A7D6I317_9MYCO|nr:ATP-binding protein [Mycobacterium vicinigordonae]QLL05718.1 ATP-binding protein [Mycobacterium vicinigordonae]
MSGTTSSDQVGFGEAGELELMNTGNADAYTVATFRQDLSDWLNLHLELDEDRAADILLATDEALSNCADHAYRVVGHVGSMSLQIAYNPATTRLGICISDHGRWIEPNPVAPPANAVRGRGILLMRALADECSIDGRPAGTTVCLRFDDCPPNSFVWSHAS